MVGAGEPLLVVEDASYAYLERFPALDEVSMSVHRGEKVARLICVERGKVFGAGNGDRTRDFHLGKVALYR